MTHHTDRVEQVDVVVVGSGIAGSAAAMTAARAARKVVLLEKLDTFGGSAALSAGMFWTAPTVEAFHKRIPLGDITLGTRLIEDYPEALDELRSCGVRVADDPDVDIMTFGVGHSTDIVAILAWCREQVLTAGGQIHTDTSVVELLDDGHQMIGLVARHRHGTVRYDAPAVVLATGGFQGARDEPTRHIGPNADRLLLRSNPGSVGDGLRLARAAGAGGTTAMSTFYGHLIGYPVRNFTPENYLSLSQYYSGSTVLVNLRGERFVDETRGDELLNQEVTFQPEARGILVFDHHVRSVEGTAEPFPGLGVIDRYATAVAAGAIHAQADTLTDLITAVSGWGVDQDTLTATLKRYAQVADAGGGISRGVPVATTARPPRTGPFYALMVQPSITFTFGGIRTSNRGEVLDHDGHPVPGLYAAGADIGGLSNYGYAGGLAPGYITGRWAGQSAATHADAASPTPRAATAVIDPLVR